MIGRRPWAGPRSLKGVSLIELMISLTIISIVLVAVFSAYLGAAGASRVADAQATMDENAQTALTILAQQLRMVGVNPAQNWTDQLNYSSDTTTTNPVYLQAPDFATPTYVNPPYDPTRAPFKSPTYDDTSPGSPFALSKYALRGCEGKFDNVDTATSLDDLTCNTATTMPNSFGVSYEADIYNTVPANAAGAPTDCAGNALYQINAKIPQPPPPPPDPNSSSPPPPPPGPAYTSNATYNDAFYYVADNRFYIAESAQSKTPTLYCRGNGAGDGVAQPLIQNVEDMQITYGTQTPGSESATVAGYLGADKLHNLSGFATEASAWDKVVAVRICLQMRSANQVATSTASARYLKCDGTLSAVPTDRRLRRTYTTTVMLRNRLL